jgi:protein SCO1/2
VKAIVISRKSALKLRYFFSLCMIIPAALAIAVPWTAPSEAHDRHKAAEISAQQVRLRAIPDARLTDQNGHQVRFTSDVLGQRPALISFIYTSCTTTCPLVGATVAAVTEHLEADLADLAVVSISIDPEYDTPARLLAWREQYGDLPRWTLLTGPKREINELLRAFGTYSANLEEHSEILLVGPNAAGQWTRMSSLAAWDKVAAVIRTATVHGRGK